MKMLVFSVNASDMNSHYLTLSVLWFFTEKGLLCWGSSKLIEKLKIDDPLDAFSVHGACGMWGVLSVGLFAFDPDDIAMAGYSTTISQGYRLKIQLLAVVVIALWTSLNGIVIFGVLNYLKRLKVDIKTEQQGLDWTHHGGAGYSNVCWFGLGASSSNSSVL